MMRIAEIFHSVQGEGQFAGTPSVFVRTTGCNLRCWFCDTRYASWEPEGVRQSWQDVAAAVEEFACEHVVITGGEPLLQPDVVPLTKRLYDDGHFITVETAATIDRPVHGHLMSISPKLENSAPDLERWRARHDALRDNRQVMRRLMGEYAYQLKFVIDRPEDVSEVRAYLADFDDVPADRVWLLPQATTREQLLEKAGWLRGLAEPFGYNVSPRLHVELFGNVRGK